MAAGGHPFEDVPKDLLICSFCNNRYRNPKLLDCLHSFCQHCLETHHRRKCRDPLKISCPVCGQETLLPSTGIEGMTTDVMSINCKAASVVFDEYKESCLCQEIQTCEVCYSDKTHHGNHPQAHSVMLPDIFSKTERTSMGDKGSRYVASKGRLDQLYCESCDKVTCRFCIAAVHRYHWLTDFKKTFMKYKNILKDMLDNVEGVTRDPISLAVRVERLRAATVGTKLEDQNRGDEKYSEPYTSNNWSLLCKMGNDVKPCTFDGACGIAFLHLDEIAVTDLHNKRVVVCTTQSELKRTIEMDGHPRDIVALNDQLVVIDNRRTVKVVNRDDTFASEFFTPQAEPDANLHSVAVKKDGTIILGDIDRKMVTEFRPTDGSVVKTIKLRLPPRYLAADSVRGRIVVSGCGQGVDVVGDTAGDPLFTIRLGEKISSGVCCDSSTIYIAVVSALDGRGEIRQYDAEGKFLCCVAGGLYRPQGISCIPDGQCSRLAVADWFSVYLYRYEAAEIGFIDFIDAGIGLKQFLEASADESVVYTSGVAYRVAYTSGVADDFAPLNYGRRIRAYQADMIRKFREQTAEPWKMVSYGIRILTGGAKWMFKYCIQTVEDVSFSLLTLNSSRPRNHLQMVLDEYKKQGGEAEHKTLQLPYIAIGYFDEKGGSLSLDEYDVHLTIPRGAIHAGPPRQVYIYIDPTAPPVDGVKPPDVALSRMVQCGPQGLKFAESVVLSFPHHAVTSSQTADELGVRMRQDEATSDTWKEFDGNVALVTEDRAILLVDHFTLFAIFGRSSKRLMVGAFGDAFEPPYRRYKFRVHVWNDEKANAQNVLDKEKCSEKLDDFRNFEFFPGKGDLAVQVLNLQKGWNVRERDRRVINEERIKKFQSNSVTFNLHQPTCVSCDEDLYCCVQSYQDSKENNSVHLSICPSSKSLSGVKGGGLCTCIPDTASELCDACKHKIQTGLSEAAHGPIDTADYGDLPKKAVMELCEHLDAERDAGNNWKQLAERLTESGYRFIRKVEGLPHPTKELLKVFFEVRRVAGEDGNMTVRRLLFALEDLELTEAADIVKSHLNHNDIA